MCFLAIREIPVSMKNANEKGFLLKFKKKKITDCDTQAHELLLMNVP